MSHSIALRTAALALCIAAVPSLASGQASVPQLRHTSAPFIGQTLTLAVDCAAPNSAVELYFSPEPGTLATPYGLLELRRNEMTLIAHGNTDAAGAWSFGLPVPLDPAWAETGAHFQALVDDPSAPAGRIFSDAVHARFLGSRVYAGHAAGLDVYSGVDDSIVASVSFAASVFGEPVFDRTFSRGAILSTPRELVLFDPYFGTVEGTVSFVSDCSSLLIADAARGRVIVLEMQAGSSPARIHAIDFVTGAETAYLDLPNPVAGGWCEGSPDAELYVGEMDPSGRPAVRRIGMDPLASLASGFIGDPTATDQQFLELIYAGGQVFSSTLAPEQGPPPAYLVGTLSRTRVVGSSLGTRTVGLWRTRMFGMTAVPEADWILAGMHATWTSGSSIDRIPITRVGGPTWLPPLLYGPTYPDFIEPDGHTAWIVGQYEYPEGDRLYRLDLDTETWTIYPVTWPNPLAWVFNRPTATALLHDALDHELWVSSRASLWNGIRARIMVQDEILGGPRRIQLLHEVESLLGVSLP